MNNSTEELPSIGSEELDLLLFMYSNKQKVLTEPSHTMFVIAYCVVFSIAVLGNILVIIAVLRKKAMRTARNIFICNLSMSDLIMSLTIPFTAMDGLTQSWPLGDHMMLCKFVKTAPCTAVFMSSLTIMAIAIDRHRVIVMSSARQVGEVGAWLLLPLIFMVSFLLSSPLLFTSKLHTMGDIFEKVYDLPDDYRIEFGKILLCYEDWSFGGKAITSKKDRIWFTMYSSFIQFFLPLGVISVIYIKIYMYIKSHRMAGTAQAQRQKRTNHILLSISLIFCLSWLPFSLFCFLSELFELFDDIIGILLLLEPLINRRAIINPWVKRFTVN